MNKIFLLMLSFLLIPIISVANPVTSADSTKCDTINVVSDSTASILHFDASLSHIDGALSKRDKQFTSALSRLDYNKYRLHHAACVALPVAVSGLALSPIDNWVASQVQTGMPNFGATVDDYLQYAPFAAQGIMALCGVDGSSGGLLEVITADALSISMMAAAVYGLKYTVSRTRPNGEDDVSFPSGHTAKAFLGATLLAHEYGHIVEYEYFYDIWETAKRNNRRFNYKQVDKDLRDMIMRRTMKKSGEKLSITEFKNKYFSKYARASQNNEWFAEAFCQLMVGEQNEFTEALKEWLEEFYE